MANFMPGESGGMPDNLGGLLNNPYLQIGLGILGNNSGHYGQFGPALSGGVLQGMQSLRQQKQFEQQQQLQQMQIDEAKRKQQEEQQMREVFKSAYNPGGETQNPNWSFADASQAATSEQPYAQPQTVNTQPSFDFQKVLPQIMGINPQTGFSMYQAMQKDNTPIKVGKGDTLVNPNTYKPVFSAPEEPKYQFAPNGKIVDMNSPDVAKSYAKPDEQPSAIKEYQFAVGQGFKGSFNDFTLAQKRAGASNQTVNMKQEGEEAKTVGKMFGDQYGDIQKAGMLAQSKINKITRLNQLLQGVETGKLTPLGVDIASTAQSLGFNIDKNLGNKQAAEALANETALELRNPSGGAGMPGAMSDQDRNYLNNMVPGLNKTPQGRKMISDSSIALAQRDKDVARLARNYRQRHGSIDEGFYNELQAFSDAHPMFTNSSKPNSSIFDQADAILKGK